VELPVTQKKNLQETEMTRNTGLHLYRTINVEEEGEGGQSKREMDAYLPFCGRKACENVCWM